MEEQVRCDVAGGGGEVRQVENLVVQVVERPCVEQEVEVVEGVWGDTLGTCVKVASSPHNNLPNNPTPLHNHP